MMNSSVPLLRTHLSPALVLAFVLACDEPQRPPSYPGTVAEWQRDSALVDSLSRLVRTDTLYHAYHASLDAKDLQAAHQQLTCMREELHLRHGLYPAQLAIERMEDTVWTRADLSRVRAHNARLPAAMVLSLNEACGFPDSLWAASDSLPPAVRLVDPRHRPRYWGK